MHSLKKIIILIICVFSFTILFTQNKNCNVNLIVNANQMDDSAKIYIVGNHPKLGNWNPSAVELEKISANLWQVQLSFPINTDLEFKFTKGSWFNEALSDDKTVPGNYNLIVEHDTTLQFKINYWKESGDEENYFNGQITGDVDYYRNLQWPGLKSRDVIVWLPPGYKKDFYKKYPVLYMHDGQNIIDPKTSTFGIDWQIDEAADSLIKQNIIEPIIIVGIYNTPDRTSEYRNVDTGFVYMDFVINKVKRLVDKNYRTKPDRLNTATGGSSLAGLISFMLAWEHPEVFSKTICVSPAFKIDFIDYVSEVQKYSGKKKELQMYLFNGGIGLENRLQPGVDEMINVLASQGYKINEDIYFQKEDSSGHNEAAWAKIIPDALKTIFPN